MDIAYINQGKMTNFQAIIDLLVMTIFYYCHFFK